MSPSSDFPAEDTLFFQFEQEFIEDLRCIPMIVRFKLDTCGIKLKLAQWNQFSEDEREQFTFQPCSSEDEIEDYREFLQDLIFMYSETEAAEVPVDENPPWLDESKIPSDLVTKAKSCKTSISLKLVKLSRPSHENKNFMPALKEFQLA